MADAFDTLPIGKKVIVSKTVSESDVYLFAGITGDFHPNHVDEAFMKRTRYGRRIAHGALLVGYMSRASTAICEGVTGRGTVVSYGFERIRFPRPCFIGDTVTVSYEIVERDPAEKKTFARVTCTTERGDVVAAATHILKVVE
jgi:acyl dehydratase